MSATVTMCCGTGFVDDTDICSCILCRTNPTLAAELRRTGELLESARAVGEQRRIEIKQLNLLRDQDAQWWESMCTEKDDEITGLHHEIKKLRVDNLAAQAKERK